MKRIFLTMPALVFLLAAGAQTLLPIRDSIGKLTISVDPRMELLGAVQLIAGYPLSTRATPYSDQVQARFGAFAGSDAVKWTKKLLRCGFAYDAPPASMLYCTAPVGLKQQHAYSSYLRDRAGGEKNLRRYRTALQRFAGHSDFARFWTENKASYRQLLDEFIHTVIRDVDVAGLLESYYKTEHKSFNVILCPLFGDCNYGPAIPDEKGGLKSYALVAVHRTGAGNFSLNSDRLLELLYHEFSHSYVNPLVDRHPDLLAQSSGCFEPVREIMASHAYPSWNICVYEHLVRAVVIRLVEATRGPQAAENAIRWEERRDFGYIRPLVAKLREYEVLRDSTGITFADYVPELLQVFSDAELYVPRFKGTVSAVLSGEKVVFVHPTVGDGAAEVTGYVHFLVDWMKSHSQLKNTLRIVADSAAVKMPLDSCNIVCYGTVENNLLLAEYREKLPFRVEPGAIVADRRYDDPDVRLIACMPNPENPLLGMAVYTAIDEGRIVNINNVFHGPDDFCIFVDGEHILSRGYFEKRGDWRFPQPKPLAE